MLAEITGTQITITLAAIACIIGLLYVFANGSKKTDPPAEPKPSVNVRCRVAGGPDHGDTFNVDFPPEMSEVLGWLRSFTKHKMLESEVLLKLDPEPTIIITRKPMKHFGHDAPPAKRHTFLEEDGR